MWCHWHPWKNYMLQVCNIPDILKCGGSCTLEESLCWNPTIRMSIQKTQCPRSLQMPKVKVVLRSTLVVKVVLQSTLVVVLTTPDPRALALATQKCRVGYAIIARPIYVRRHQGCHHKRLRIGIGEGVSIPNIKIFPWPQRACWVWESSSRAWYC